VAVSKAGEAESCIDELAAAGAQYCLVGNYHPGLVFPSSQRHHDAPDMRNADSRELSQ